MMWPWGKKKRAQETLTGFAAGLLSEVWAIHPDHLTSFLDCWSEATELFGELASRQEVDAVAMTGEDDSSMRPGYRVRDGVAIIPIKGTILKSVPKWAVDFIQRFEIPVTGSMNTAEAIRMALADDSVRSILLEVDSPGGQVSGLAELSDVLFMEARGKKPVRAHIENMGASAAYWIAAQAEKVTASESARVGSIGVYVPLIDDVAALEARGIKVHVVRSGPDKGLYEMGQPVDEKVKERFQSTVNDFARIFNAHVARGRGKSPDDVQKNWASGKDWIAGDAMSLGLVDEVRRPGEAASEAMQPADQKNEAEQGSVLPMENLEAQASRGEQGMTEEEIQALKAALEAEKAARAKAEENAAKAKAESEMRAKALEAQQANARSDAIQQAINEGRILPAQKEGFEKAAEAYGADLDGLKGFLGSLPSQVRSPVGHDGVSSPSPSVDLRPADKHEAACEDSVKSTLGLTDAEWNAAKLAKGYSPDGRPMVEKNGRLTPVSWEELDKMAS